MQTAERAVEGTGRCVGAGELVEVLAEAAVVVRRDIADPDMRSLLLTAVDGLTGQMQDEELHPFAILPLRVYAAIRGESDQARPLAVVTTLLFLGIDILDDLQDGDLPEYWRGRRPAEIQLAAAALLASLPQMGIAQLNILPMAKARMIACLSEGLLRMSYGQLQDIRAADTAHVTPEDVEKSVEHKSGEECALIAMLAAHMAGVSEETAQQYGDFGRALGTAGQIASDCYDIFQATHSKDLANGTRCFPLVVYLSRLAGKDREAFLHLLERAKESDAARELIRRDLRTNGALRMSAFIVELHCQRAREVLDRLGLTGPEREGLEKMVNHVSFFTTHKEGV